MTREFGIPLYSPPFWGSQYKPFLVLNVKVISYKTLVLHAIEKIPLVMRSLAPIFSIKCLANAAGYQTQGII